MRYQFTKQIAVLGLVVAALACPSVSRADNYTIHSGWDLFVTDPNVTTFMYVPFQGVPLETFSLGGTNYNVGDTDTIIQRDTNIIGPAGGGSTNFSATLVAWQLRTVDQVNLGAGFGYYYLTLQPDQTSTSSGTMTFNSGGTNGTFADDLHVYYELNFGTLTGQTVLSNDCTLSNSGAPWTRDGSYPPIITNVNYLLDGTDTSEDFWPGVITHYGEAGSGNVHSVIPEPSTMSLVCIAGIVGLWRMRRKLLRR